MTEPLPTICGPNQLDVLRAAADAIETDQVGGEIWECGVYLGGSATVLAARFPLRTIRLFDTFGPGIPERTERDPFIQLGQFAITTSDKERIQKHFEAHPNVRIHAGFIPATFDGLDASAIALAHIDVDTYQTYAACLAFIYPRLESGGCMVFDDYGHVHCDGATQAVDEFMALHPELSLVRTPGWGAHVRRVA